MSGRNSRMIRNREKKGDFTGNFSIAKIIASIVLVLAIIGMVMFQVKHRKNPVRLAEVEENVSYEYFMLSTETGIGVIDKKGNLILEAKFDKIAIPNPAKDVFVTYVDGKCEVLNRKKEAIFNNYEQIDVVESSEENGEIEKEVLQYKKGNLYGLLSLDGQMITDAVFSQISSLNERPGRILVKKDEKYGILDSQGNYVIDIKYDQITADGYWSNQDAYHRTGYIVSQKAKDGVNFGYINDKGKTVLDVKYEAIERALEYDDNEVYLIAMQKGKKGVFKQKKKIIDLNFQDINYSNLSKVFVVNKNGKYGFYHLNGKMILKPEYKTYSMAGNYISVVHENETQLFDINGNLVGTNSYTQMIETDNPTYFIAEDEDGYYSIISKDVELNEKYTQVSYAFHHYFIFTDKTGKSGVVNALTKEIEIEPQYDFILLIEGTKSLQAIDGIHNLVDIYDFDLKKTVTMVDGIVESINDQYAVCYSENDMKYIDVKGQVVPNTQVYPNKQMYATQENGKWGFVSANENLVLPCEYDIVTEFNSYGFAGIKKDGKWGVIDETGAIIVEPTYELDTYYFPQFIGKYVLIQSEITYCEEV